MGYYRDERKRPSRIDTIPIFETKKTVTKWEKKEGRRNDEIFIIWYAGQNGRAEYVQNEQKRAKISVNAGIFRIAAKEKLAL